MGKTVVRQGDLPALIAELQDLGATGIRRSPARFNGKVGVTWREDDVLPASEAKYRADLRAQLPLYIVSWTVAVLFVLVMVVLAVFRGS